MNDTEWLWLKEIQLPAMLKAVSCDDKRWLPDSREHRRMKRMLNDILGPPDEYLSDMLIFDIEQQEWIVIEKEELNRRLKEEE